MQLPPVCVSGFFELTGQLHVTLDSLEDGIGRLLLELAGDLFDQVLAGDSYRVRIGLFILVLDELLGVGSPVLDAVVGDLHIEDGVVAKLANGFFDSASVAALLLQL